MTTYVTRNHRYEVTKVGERELIRVSLGGEERTYGIIGFFDDNNIKITGFNESFFFWDTNGKSIKIEDLPRHLDQTAGLNKRIMARLVNPEGEFLPSSERDDCFISSEIARIEK